MSDPDSMSQAPTRLLDDPGLDASLRQDLGIAGRHTPIAYDVEAGLARFEQAVAAAPGSGAAVSVSQVLGWVLGAAVLIGGSVGTTWLLQREPIEHVRVAGAGAGAGDDSKVRAEDDPVVGAKSSGATEARVGSRHGESVAEVGVRDGAGDAGAALAQAEGDSSELVAPTPPRPASISKFGGEVEPDSADALADEARQVNEARKALASDPAKTLALMEAAEQQFPSGAMIQERRGYAILALVALGRLGEANTRADAYLERWPKGALSRRIADALGRPTSD